MSHTYTASTSVQVVCLHEGIKYMASSTRALCPVNINARILEAYYCTTVLSMGKRTSTQYWRSALHPTLPYLGRIPAELLAKGQRCGILGVGAANLDDVCKLLALCLQRSLSSRAPQGCCAVLCKR
jgi:hypothetical protein